MRRLLTNLIGIGRATLVDDTGELQRVQVTEGAAGSGFADRITDKVARVAEFGFASSPPLDSEVLVLRRGGERSRSIVIGTSHRPSRPNDLKAGDAGIYDVRGAKVLLTEHGLVIDCAGLPAIVQNATQITLKATDKVTIDAPTVEVLHDLKVSGKVDAVGQITSDTEVAVGSGKFTVLRQAYGAHKHGGVSTGSGNTVGPDKAG